MQLLREASSVTVLNQLLPDSGILEAMNPTERYLYLSAPGLHCPSWKSTSKSKPTVLGAQRAVKLMGRSSFPNGTSCPPAGQLRKGTTYPCRCNFALWFQKVRSSRTGPGLDRGGCARILKCLHSVPANFLKWPGWEGDWCQAQCWQG